MNFSALFSNKRNVIILIVAVLLLLGLTVVFLLRPTTPTDVPPPPVQPIQADLTWWKPFYGAETYNEIIQDFKQSNPAYARINIKLVTKDYGDGSNYYRSIINDIARDAGPDIFTIRNDDLPAYAQYMTPNSLITGPVLTKYKQDFVPLAVRDTTAGDEVYAITSYVENMQLYYNENILSQAGIALPAQSWADLDRQLPLLNRRGAGGLNFRQNAISLGTGGRGAEGAENINRFQDIIPLLIFQSGGSIYDSQTGQVTLGQDANETDVQTGLASSNNFGSGDGSEALDALDFYTDFADVRSNRYSWNTSSPNNIDQFVNGDLAYMLHYKYMDDILQSRNSRLRYSVAPLPQLDPENKKTFGFFFMDGMSIELSRNPAKANRRAAAEAFLYYLSTPAAQNKLAVKTQLPSARKDVITEQQQSDNTTAVFASGALYADNYYKPSVEGVEQIWADLVERIQYEGQPLRDSLGEARAEYQNYVSRGPEIR